MGDTRPPAIANGVAFDLACPVELLCCALRVDTRRYTPETILDASATQHGFADVCRRSRRDGRQFHACVERSLKSLREQFRIRRILLEHARLRGPPAVVALM